MVRVPLACFKQELYEADKQQQMNRWGSAIEQDRRPSGPLGPPPSLRGEGPPSLSTPINATVIEQSLDAGESAIPGEEGEEKGKGNDKDDSDKDGTGKKELV